MDVDTIHESLVNGQKKQAGEQIKNYRPDVITFFEDYRDWLDDKGHDDRSKFHWFSQATLAYLRGL